MFREEVFVPDPRRAKISFKVSTPQPSRLPPPRAVMIAAVLLLSLASATAFAPSKVSSRSSRLAFSPKIFDKAVDEWKKEYQVTFPCMHACPSSSHMLHRRLPTTGGGVQPPRQRDGTADTPCSAGLPSWPPAMLRATASSPMVTSHWI